MNLSDASKKRVRRTNYCEPATGTPRLLSGGEKQLEHLDEIQAEESIRSKDSDGQKWGEIQREQEKKIEALIDHEQTLTEQAQRLEAALGERRAA